VDVVGSHVIIKTTPEAPHAFAMGGLRKQSWTSRIRSRPPTIIISSAALIQINADPNKSALFPATQALVWEAQNGSVTWRSEALGGESTGNRTARKAR
jgi:hypothetical protein